MKISGKNAALEVLRHAPERVKSVVLKNVQKNEPWQKELFELLHQASISYKTSLKVENYCELELKDYPVYALDEIADFAVAGKKPILILDQITDPHNLGAIFRAAACADVAALLYTANSSAAVSDLVRRVSMGGTELVPHLRIKNLQRAIEELKSRGVWVYGTCLDESSSSLYELDLPGASAFVLGSEGRGVRRLTKKCCDALLYIPMSGRLQSLNVSQACSVLLFEINRKNV